MGTFTVSTLMETMNVPIIGLAQARASGRVSDPVQARMFLRAPEQVRNPALHPSPDPDGSDPPAASAASLPTLRATTSLMRTA